MRGGRAEVDLDPCTLHEIAGPPHRGEIGKLPVSHPGTQIAVSSSDVTIFVHREVQRGGYDYRLWRTYRQSHAFSPDAIDPMDDGGQRLGALAPSGKLSVIPNSSGEVSSEIGPMLAIDAVSAPIDLARGPGAPEACLRSLPGTIAMSTLATPGACLVEPTLRDVSVKGTSLLPIQVIGGTITFSAGAAPATLEWTSLAATKIVARDRALSVDHVYLEGGRDHDSLDTGSLDFRANAALGIVNATFRGSWVGALGSSAVKLDRVAFDRPRLVAFSLHAVPPSPAALVPATLDLNRVEVTSYFPALDVLGATVHIDGLTYQGAASKPRPAGTTSTTAPAVLLARSSGFVHHTTIRASGGDGILLDNVGELEITDTTVTDSAKHGIEVVSDVPPLLGPCRPVKTMSPVNEGRFPPYSPDPHLARCVVSRNGGAGVEISGPHILMLIEQSTFERNVAEGVAIRSGRGFSQGGADLTCPSGERDGRDVDVPLNQAPRSVRTSSREIDDDAGRRSKTGDGDAFPLLLLDDRNESKALCGERPCDALDVAVGVDRDREIDVAREPDLGAN